MNNEVALILGEKYISKDQYNLIYYIFCGNAMKGLQPKLHRPSLIFDWLKLLSFILESEIEACFINFINNVLEYQKSAKYQSKNIWKKSDMMTVCENYQQQNHFDFLFMINFSFTISLRIPTWILMPLSYLIMKLFFIGNLDI